MKSKFATSALVLCVTSVISSSSFAQSFKVSLGVRETNSTAAIGAPSTPNSGSIEWINKDGNTVAADGTWHQLTWTFGTDPVATFTGDGVLQNTRNAFEHLRILNDQGVTSQATMLVDDVVNTVGGVPTTIADFESVADNALALFQVAHFSGSTSTNVVANGTSKTISTAAHSGAKSGEYKFQFIDSTPSRWIRYVTSANNTNPYANPTIDTSVGSTLSLWINITVPNVVVGWNTDSDGNWSDVTKWAGPATDNIPNTNAEIARFLPTTAPRTVTVDQDFIVNGLNFNSPNTYTIAGTNKLTLNSPAVSGVDGSLVVQAGNHVISAPLETRVRVAASIPTGTSLKTPGIAAVTAIGEDASDTLDIVKTGAGVLETGHLRFNLATINGGTVKIAADGTDAATSELNQLTFAGGTAPTAKLDLTNNAMIIDWDTAATTPRPNALLSTRGRIVNGYNGGDWAGNGITSSSAAANSSYALGYGDAATLGLASFGGRLVDAEATVVLYTRKGDHDLDKDVDFDDLLNLAQNYDPAYDPIANGPKIWTEGEYNYDGIVNFDDLLALAQNYGSTALTTSQIDMLGSSFAADWQLALSVVPEPTSLCLLGGLATAFRRRR